MAIHQNAQGEPLRDRRYSTGFPVRCTEAEKHKIFSRAERANQSASRFLVELAIADGDKALNARPSREELEVLEGLMVQLRRIASNLLELASREHTAADDDSEASAAAEIHEAVLQVRGLLDQLRSRLA